MFSLSAPAKNLWCMGRWSILILEVARWFCPALKNQISSCRRRYRWREKFLEWGPIPFSGQRWFDLFWGQSLQRGCAHPRQILGTEGPGFFKVPWSLWVTLQYSLGKNSAVRLLGSLPNQRRHCPEDLCLFASRTLATQMGCLAQWFAGLGSPDSEVPWTDFAERNGIGR